MVVRNKQKQLMNIETGIDSVRGGIVIMFTSPLLEKYYKNFSGMASKKGSGLPEGTTTTRRGSTGGTAEIFIPHSEFQRNQKELEKEIERNTDKSGMANIRVTVDAMIKIESTKSFIGRFIVTAVNSIMKRTEICPVLDFSGGYSFEELQKDVVEANKNKRDILVIDSYKNYINSARRGNCAELEYNQYLIPFGTSEYCDFVLTVRSSSKEEVAKAYKDKLKRTIWV